MSGSQPNKILLATGWAIALTALFSSVTTFARGPLEAEALRQLRSVRVPSGRADLSGPLLELHQLKILAGETNPKLESLALLKGPLNVEWPPRLHELEQLLRSDAGDLGHQWLGRARQLLRVEKEMRKKFGPGEGYEKLSALEQARSKLLLGGQKTDAVDQQIAQQRAQLAETRQELLRDIARRDLDYLLHTGQPEGGKPADSYFAGTRVRFPPELKEALAAVLPPQQLKQDASGTVSVSALEARALLDKKLPPELQLDVSRAISQSVRRQLPSELNNRREAENFVDVLKKRESVTSPGSPAANQPNSFAAAAGPSCSRAGLSPQLEPFYRLSPSEEHATPEDRDNACMVSDAQPENRLAATVSHDPAIHALQHQGGPDSFQMVMHTTQGDADGKVGACMGSILNPQAIPGSPVPPAGMVFPPSPGRNGMFRVVMLTASHCLHGDLNSFELPGYGEEIPRSDMEIHPVPNSDASMVSFDVPAETAFLLSQAREHLVNPPPRELDVTHTTVVQDPNVDADHTKRNIGSTFAVRAANQVGLNFKTFGNQGIFPGDSGGGVFALVNGAKTWLGAMSYKCLDSRFQDSVGAMASGPQVFAFINDNLSAAVNQPIYGDTRLVSHRGLDHGLFQPVHAQF